MEHTDVLVAQDEDSPPDVPGPPKIDGSRIASDDPVLACITNLTARILNCKRSMITIVSSDHSYIAAESTQSLSIASPHTSEPGDEIWLGSGTRVSAEGSLCEHTVSLLPPANPHERDMLLEINDLSQDPQYHNAGFVVNWPYKRFYGATPLRTRNGVSIGALCVFDDKPKPNGLTEEEKITLSKLGDTVMNYLQVKQGDRDLKKGKVMEMCLSKFIAEGFLPGEGLEMTERRGGQLWSEKILEHRRLKEMERIKKVEERRAMIQERKFAEMVKGREREWQREMEKVRQQYLAVEKRPTSVCDVTAPPTDPSIEFEDTTRKKPQSALSETLPKTSVLPELATTVSVAALNSPTLSESNTYTALQVTPYEEEAERSLIETIMNTTARRPSIPSLSPSLSAVTQDYLPTPPPSNLSGTGGYFDQGRSSSVQSTTDSTDGPRRRSEYEQTSSFESHFRAMFFRAATLIRNIIDANVVFLDGDLEGFFGAEEAECPVYSHVSTDKESEAAARAERPKACRRRSGILGYATAGGSSCGTAPSAHDTVESLGFDVSELNEEYLNRLVEENPTGRIVTHLQDFHAGECEDDGHQTDAILQRFLPGAKSVILVPLVDHNRKLFAVCVVWTNCATKSFCGDVEGSFVTAVTNTIISETTRLNILNADKAKGEFISSISHELRSPLHGILASAEFLAESNLDAYQRSFVDTVISCGTTLLDTINHVLDFQKLNYLQEIKVCKSGTEDAKGDKINNIEEVKMQQVKQQRDVDLSALVQDIVDGVCLGSGFCAAGDREDTISGSVYREDDKKLTVIVDIDHRDDGWIFCLNPAGLKRVINNLTGNAMKYTESGWVRVRLRADEISGDGQGNRRAMVKISISDSGKGISRSFLKTKLFTPFSQENPLAPGAGLGMSIVHQIVGAMDGKIDVKSQVGKGTKVTVQVPMIYRPKPSVNLDDDIRSRIRGMRMRMIGFETPTHTQPKGEAANLLRGSVVRYAKDYLGLEVLRDDTREPDIIIANEITDNILREIQSLRQKPPVILLCRHPSMDGGASQLTGHISTFIRKPCGPKKFARAMAFCLGEMQKRSTDSGYETAPEELDDAASEQFVDTLDLRVGLTRSTSASSHPDHDPATPATTAPSISSLDIDSFFGDELAVWRSAPDLDEPSEVAVTKPSPLEPRKPTVLAVEDNTINLMLLTTFLEKNGYNFDKAVDGLEALRKVKQKEGGYDVILMDLRTLPSHSPICHHLTSTEMPIMSGIESTREIRRHEEERGKRSLVVALTGLAAVSDQKEAYAAGVDSFMVKPVNFKELERTLAERLSLG